VNPATHLTAAKSGKIIDWIKFESKVSSNYVQRDYEHLNVGAFIRPRHLQSNQTGVELQRAPLVLAGT
jgi:hypothetical protein